VTVAVPCSMTQRIQLFVDKPRASGGLLECVFQTLLLLLLECKGIVLFLAAFTAAICKL